MLRTILGSAIGGLMAGAVALGVSASVRTPAPALGADPNNPYAMSVANTSTLGQGPSVQCQAYQEPVVRRVIIGGREVAEVICATRMDAQAAYAPQPAYASDIVSMPVQRTRIVARPASLLKIRWRHSNARETSARMPSNWMCTSRPTVSLSSITTRCHTRRPLRRCKGYQ